MKILIATDGSEFSKAAIEECCRIMPLETASVKVISAAQLATTFTTEPYVACADYIQEIQDLIVEQAKNSVVEGKKLIENNFPAAKVETASFTRCLSPAVTIVEEAENWGADLIVVGSHGYGFWSRALLGSVSSAVAHHAPCSVLIVRTKQTIQ